METTKEIKLMIIENFIDWYTTDENEQIRMKEAAEQYVDGDHVDEIKQFI
jgi:hypothetical protein